MTQLPLTGAGPSGSGYIPKVLGYNPIAYWPLNETAGATANCLVNAAQDGTYTGVTLGQSVTDANGVTFVCPFFDGANDFVACNSAAFTAAFDGQEGTIAVWLRMNAAGVWTDGTFRYIWQLNAGGAEYTRIYKSTTNNIMSYRYLAGGVAESGDESGLSITDWMHLALTWSLSAGANGEVRYWRDGAEVATVDTTLGTWAQSIDAGYPIIGASSTVPGSPAHGWLAHCAVFASSI